VILPVRIVGDPVLYQRASEVEEITDELRELARNMIETMIRFEGIGLAANQIGIPLRIITVDPRCSGFNTDPFALINPVLIDQEGEEEAEEGCLSIPGVYLIVPRAERVKVKGIDIDGKETVIRAEGLFARVLQHEIDHINGRLITYYSNGKEV